jgi:O-antigen/teichoic acid export membrane protein
MIAAFVLMSSPGSVFALILMAVCIGAVSAFSGIHLWKLISLQGGTCVTAYHIKDWLKAAWPMMFVLTLQMLIHRTDVVMLGFLSDAGETGQYAAASKIAQAATLLHIAVINVFSAHAAVHFRKKDYAALKTSYQKVQFLQFAGVLLMAVALALIARPVLGFLGSGFTGAEIIIYLLLAGHVVNALWGPSASLLIMTDYEKPLMRITTFSLATNIMLNLLLIPATGAAGAAIATIVSLNLRNAGSLLYARKIKLLTGGKDHASA